MLHGERNLTKALLAWGGMILVLSLPLCVYTVYWWLILIFGVVLPIAVGLGERLVEQHSTLAPSHPDRKERELLEALGHKGELTPAAAAMKTSLTVSEADRILSELAQNGYLQVRADGGMLCFSLWNDNRKELHNPD